MLRLEAIQCAGFGTHTDAYDTMIHEDTLPQKKPQKNPQNNNNKKTQNNNNKKNPSASSSVKWRIVTPAWLACLED